MIPSFVPIPPADITGILQCLFSSGIISSGVSFPACPPALQLTAITASAPNCSTLIAYFSSTTSQNTFIPLSLHNSITCFGLPNEVIIKSTPNSTQVFNCC